MKNLLYKEFRLASHPAAFLFMGLAAMMCIPNYPLSVTFFYPCLGAFFICLTGRENRDIFYTMLLPVRKKDLVAARMAHIAILQLGQIVLCVPFLFVRSLYPPAGNEVGLDANAALLGFGLFQMGLFNLVFFPRHYRDPAKVGGPFLLGTVAVFLWAGISEVLPHAVPWIRDRLDTPLFQYVPEKLAVSLLGAVCYGAFTLWACRTSQNRFEKLDINS